MAAPLEWLWVDGSDSAAVAASRPTAIPASLALWVGAHGLPHGRHTATRRPGDTDAQLAADLVSIFQRGLVAEAAAGLRSARGKASRRATIDAMLARAASSVEPGGKWVLTRTRETVDRAWATVARLTAAGALGHSAKVATTDPPMPGRRPQTYPIIVYTATFEDAADVRRVLDALVGAGLAPRLAGDGGAGPRPIGYKINAWTHFEMVSKREERGAVRRLKRTHCRGRARGGRAPPSSCCSLSLCSLF